MGKQVIILGLSGSFDPELAAGLVVQLQQRLSVRHVSHFYDGTGLLKFATGTQADLQGDLHLLSKAVPDLPSVELAMAAGVGGEDTALTQEQLEEVLELLRGLDERTAVHLKEFREATKEDEAAPAKRARKTLAPLPAKKEGGGSAVEGGDVTLAGSPPAEAPPGGWPMAAAPPAGEQMTGSVPPEDAAKVDGNGPA